MSYSRRVRVCLVSRARGPGDVLRMLIFNTHPFRETQANKDKTIRRKNCTGNKVKYRNHFLVLRTREINTKPKTRHQRRCTKGE